MGPLPFLVGGMEGGSFGRGLEQLLLCLHSLHLSPMAWVWGDAASPGLFSREFDFLLQHHFIPYACSPVLSHQPPTQLGSHVNM